MNYLRLSLIITGVAMAFFATPTPPIQAQQLCGEGRITGTVRYSPASLPLADLGDITFELKGPHGFSETKVGKPRELKIDFSHLATGTYTYKASGVIEKDPVSFGPLTLTVDGDETVNIILEQKGGGHLQGSFLPSIIPRLLGRLIPTAQAADQPCASLQGKVTNKRGEPLGGVTIVEITSSGEHRPLATTASDGTYKNEQLQAKTYTLATEKVDTVGQKSVITLKALPQTNTKNFALSRLIPVKIRSQAPVDYAESIELKDLPLKVFETGNTTPLAQLTTPAETKLEEGKTYRFLAAKQAKLSRLDGSLPAALYAIENNDRTETVTTSGDSDEIIFNGRYTGRAILVELKENHRSQMKDVTVTLNLKNGKKITKSLSSGKKLLFSSELDESSDGAYKITSEVPSDYTPIQGTVEGELPGFHSHQLIFEKKCLQKDVEGIPFTFCGDEAETIGRQSPTHPGVTYIAESINAARQMHKYGRTLLCGVLIEHSHDQYMGEHGVSICGDHYGIITFPAKRVTAMTDPLAVERTSLWHEIGHGIDFVQGNMGLGVPDYASSSPAKTNPALTYKTPYDKSTGDERIDLANRLLGSYYYNFGAGPEKIRHKTYWRTNTMESFAEQYVIDHYDKDTFAGRVNQYKSLPNTQQYSDLYRAFQAIKNGEY